MHVEQLFFTVVWSQIRETCYKNRLSVTKDCKTKQAEVQISSSSRPTNRPNN